MGRPLVLASVLMADGFSRDGTSAVPRDSGRCGVVSSPVGLLLS